MKVQSLLLFVSAKNWNSTSFSCWACTHVKKNTGTNAVCVYKSIGFMFFSSLFDKKAIPLQWSVELAYSLYKVWEVADYSFCHSNSAFFMVLIWFSLQIDFLWQIDLLGIWFCPTETILQLPRHLTMLLAIFSVFTLGNSFLLLERDASLRTRSKESLNTHCSPHRTSLIWMLKLPTCLKFSVGGDLEELRGELGECCVCPPASHALGWWASCWGRPEKHKR